MEVEILWNYDTTRNLLEDLKSFANSLDDYQIVWGLTKADEEKFVYLKEESYEVSFEKKLNAFKCPKCEAESFEVMEGKLVGKPTLGLCCLNCESYGAVFPNGL